MGYLSYVESQSRATLPHTPPDLVNFGCSPSSYAPSEYTSHGPPPKDLSWPHPKPPISPPMSSHDHPPPPSPKLLSPVRPSSSSDGMSMAATAAASLARTAVSCCSTSSNVTKISAITEALPTTTTEAAAAQGSTTGETTSLTGSPQQNAHQPALGPRDEESGRQQSAAPNAPVREKLPSLSSIFGLSPLERPPTSALASTGQPSLSQTPRTSYGALGRGADDRSSSSATAPADTYQRPPYQSHHGRPPSPPSAAQSFLPPPPSTSQAREQPPYPFPYHHDRLSPRSNERQHANHLYPPSPRSREHEQQHHQQQQQQQHHQHQHAREQQQQKQTHQDSPQSSRQWPDSRSAFVAVGQWSIHQEGVKLERSRYGEHEPYQRPPSDSQRYPQLLPPAAGAQGASTGELYRHQQEEPRGAYHGHNRKETPHHQFPPPPSHSPVGISSPVVLPRPPPSLPGSLPSTPASAAFPEGGPPKEGMGPKIWTGVDFLPQFMHASEVPGEGTCYFYDDGSHCKAVIDGEAVNPYWGVTKAGKPRKRLAIACMTCREKKIKCDPEFPRCVQCEKFGRVCRFKNAPRGGNNTSPGTSSTEPDTSRNIGSGSIIRPPPESPRTKSYPNSGMDSPRTGMTRPLSPNPTVSSGPNKRSRTDYDHYTTSGGRGRSPPFSNRSPTFADGSRATSGSVLPPLSWGASSSQQSQGYSQSHACSPPLPPPPPPPSSSYPRSSHSQQPQQQQQQHSQQHSQQHQHHSSQPQSYHRHSYRDQPRSQPTSPSHPELPRMLLPPPRSTSDLPRVHDDVLRRSWQPDLRPHGRA